MPRPTRFRSFRLCAGFREVRLSSSAIVDLHEVPDLAKHACEHRAVVVLGGLADPTEPERAERAAMLLALPDLATNLGYPNFRHRRLRLGLGLPWRNLPVPPNPLHWSAVADRRLLGRLRSRLLRRRMLIRQNLADRQAARLRDVLGTPEVLQPVHGRLRHVDRIRRPEALGEDVADPGQLQDGSDPAAGD